MHGAVDIIMTDFGPVEISERSLAWLNSISPEWREILRNKRPRGKHAGLVRNTVQRFVTAVNVAAEIERFSGGELKEF